MVLVWLFIDDVTGTLVERRPDTASLMFVTTAVDDLFTIVLMPIFVSKFWVNNII